MLAQLEVVAFQLRQPQAHRRKGFGLLIQLRLEAFSVTKTATFATPHVTFGASNFGVIDSYAGSRGPRELQVAIKFYF